MRTTRGTALALLAPAAFVAFLFALPEPAATTPEADAPALDFAIEDGLVFDGEAFHEDADLWIAGGRVKALGRDLELPEALPRVSARGRSVLPGLIDAHTHTFGTARADALRFGVTTLLDHFTHPSLVEAARPARESVGASDGADLFSAGFLATAPQGHGTQYGITVPTLTRPEEAQAWVDARLGEGSDWIKIVYDDGSLYGIDDSPTLDLETVKALIDAAHARDVLAVVHVSRLADGLAVTDAGADGLVHVWMDEAIEPEAAERLAATGAFVVPTLAVNLAVTRDQRHGGLPEGPVAERLSSEQRASLGRRFPVREASKADVEASFRSIRRLHAAGVPLLAGSDAPNPGTAHGLTVHREVRLLESAGFSDADALAAATSGPADAFGLADRGRLAPGRLADLLLVEGDVREDLSRTLDVAGVWKDGHPVEVGLPAGASSRPAAAGAEGPLALGDFEGGTRPTAWEATTDAMMNGASEARIAVEDGALVVRGEVKPGFAFPWAGAAVGLAGGAGADLSSHSELLFRAQGGGHTARVMLIVPGNPGPPPTAAFEAGAEWSEHRLPLADFAGADLSRVQAIAFVAGPAPGAFEIRLDDVEVR